MKFDPYRYGFGLSDRKPPQWAGWVAGLIIVFFGGSLVALLIAAALRP